MWLPEFLNRPIEEWPISKDTIELPDRVCVILSSNVQEQRNHMRCTNLICFDLNRYSNYNKLMKVTSMVLCVVKNKSFKVFHLQNAEFEWLKFIENDIPNDWKERFKRLGPTRNKDGLICVGERMANWLKMNWNQNLFILLPTKCRFSYRIEVVESICIGLR